MINYNSSGLTLSNIVKANKEINLPRFKKILSLPNDLVFVVDTRDNFMKMFDGSDGTGHEPYTIKKIIDFTDEGDVYVEIGANYGDFVFQVSHKIGNKGKAFAFEPGSVVFKDLETGLFLNGLSNIVIENYVVTNIEGEVNFIETDQQDLFGTLGSHVSINELEDTENKIKSVTLDSYFNNSLFNLDVIRLDAEGSECRVLEGARNIIKSSPNIRLFVEWQKSLLSKFESMISMEHCLSNLEKEGFIFLDILEFNYRCDSDYLPHKLSVDNLLMSNSIELLIVRESFLIKFFKENKIINYHNKNCHVDFNELLFNAALNKATENVRYYLDKGADINFFSTSGGTSLYIASQRGDANIVKYLIENGANLEVKSVHGISPLYIAAVNNHYEVVSLLLEAGASTEGSSPVGYTALCVAAYYGREDLINLLLKYGAKTKPDLIDKNVIEIAKENGHNEVEEYILKYNNNEQKIINESLFIAAQMGDFIKVESLISAGADVNELSNVGATPLFISSQNGYLAIVDLLLLNGAKTEISWGGQTPLFMAVQNNHIKVVEQLLKAGANTEAKNGTTSLYLAVTKENIEMVELLLKYHSNTEVKIGEYTPLSLSVYNGDTENVRLLLNHKASVEVNIEGFNLLYIAAKRGFTEIVSLLIKSGLDLQEGQINGKTPLDIAAENGHVDIVKLLLNEGANIGKSQKNIFTLFYKDNSEDVKSSAKDMIIDKLLKAVSCLESQALQTEDYLEICGINSISFMESDHD
jgi:FkbM family methyltransferase